jgi:hypothetical protein
VSARARGFAACAVCLLSSPTLAQTIPGHGGSVWNGTDMIVASLFVVKNNSGLPITCARGLPDRLLGAAQIHWGDRFVTASGADVSFSDLSPRLAPGSAIRCCRQAPAGSGCSGLTRAAPTTSGVMPSALTF